MFADQQGTATDRSGVVGNRTDKAIFAGRTGIIKKEDWNDNQTIYHESLHFLGLPDYYYEPIPGQATPMEGFENDIMGNRVLRIGIDHYRAYYRRVKEVYDQRKNSLAAL